MISLFRKLRLVKKHTIFLCLFSLVFVIWFHRKATIEIFENADQRKQSAQLGVVYKWMVQSQNQNPAVPNQDQEGGLDSKNQGDQKNQLDPSKNHVDPSKSLADNSKSLIDQLKKQIDQLKHQLESSRKPSDPKNQPIQASKPFASPINISDQIDTNQYHLSHPFENTCQYPVLIPEDEDLWHVIDHTRVHVCKRVQEDLLIFDYDRGELIFNKSLTQNLYQGRNPRCQYRPFSGAILPHIAELKELGPWTSITNEITKIDHDLIEVLCLASPEERIKNVDPGKNQVETEIFRFAFGQIAKKEGADNGSRKFKKNDERTLSVDLLFLDSTSLNMMRRHAPKSWKYMKEVMGFYHLEGYTKVGDNSMVNIMPVLTGLRYGDHADDMKSEVPPNETNHAERWPWPWRFFREKNCATMFNDDIAHYSRGFLNYPWPQFKGFAEYPTDHFIRPWHVYHRRYPLQDSTNFCFGNYFYAKLQLNFLEQLIKKYHDACHFSFNFITDLSHDDPCNLELLDDDLQGMLQRIYTGGYLNNTVLFVMGDHGHRIGRIMYSYVGRIEERMSFFSVYFPEWYRKKHAKAMRQLEINKNRLTSNYDVHRMIREIFNDTLSQESELPTDPKLAVSKAVSLFRPIPTDRTCNQANIPPHHCVCLEPVPIWSSSRNLSISHRLYQWSKTVVLDWTRARIQTMSEFRNKCRPIDDIEILKIEALTTSQMIQHGVRDQNEEQMKRLERRIDGDIEYVDMIYKMRPVDLTARVRLQHYKKNDGPKLFVLVPPVLSPVDVSKRPEGPSCLVTGDKLYHWLCQCL